MSSARLRRLPVRLHPLLALAVCLGFGVNTNAQTYYNATGLTPPASINSTFPLGINSSGQIVGFANRPGLPPTAFMWHNGIFTDLGQQVAESQFSVARGLNDFGQIVGNANDHSGRDFGAIWQYETMISLRPLILQSGLFDTTLPLESIAYRVNNTGQILGDVYAFTQSSRRIFLYSNGAFTIINVPTTSNSHIGSDLNNLGQVVGQFERNGTQVGFLWDAGILTELNGSQGRNFIPNGINDVGQIVGHSNSRAVLYQNGIATDIHQIGLFSIAFEINNYGVIVGYTVAPTGNAVGIAFVYDGGVMKDLNDITSGVTSGFTLAQAMGINDAGRIICVGSRPIGNNLFEFRTFLLTPVSDTTAPQIGLYDVITEATSASGAIANYSFGLFDDYDRFPTATYSIPSGTLFPIGTTSVTVTARDASGNTRVQNFNVIVVDNPPNLSLPGDIVTNATSATGAAVTYFASANDVISGPEPVQCSPASGSTFPIGTTNVNCSATDGAGNTATGSFNVYVLTADQSFTPPDGYVTLQPTNGPTLTFYNVYGSGVTTVIPIDAASIGTTPAGFALSNGIAYQISTTAAFDDIVQLDFAVPGPISETDFNNLSILHNDNGNLVDVTGGRSYDSQNQSGTITGYTYSFSPFYLVKKVGLKIAPLFDQTKAFKAGSTVPIKLQLVNEAGMNVSAPETSLNARNSVRLGSSTSSAVIDAGNANPDLNFRYDAGLKGYIFNLKTTGLQPGSYALSFYAGNDLSFFYTVKFEVK